MSDLTPRSPRETRSRPLSKLALLFGLQLVFSAAYITYFSYSFDFGERVIALHVSVVALVMISVALVLGLALRRARSAPVRLLIAMVPAGAFATLILLYAANVLSTGAWGHNVTFDLAARYITRPSVLVTYLAAVASWPVVAAIGAIALAGALYLAWSSVVVQGLEELVGSREKGRAASTMTLGLAAAAGGLAALAGAALLFTISGFPRYELLAREPLIGFFLDTVSSHRFALSTFAARFREEGPAVRAGYPVGQTFERRNVVVIVADSLRADHLNIYGYERPTSPFLERLSRSGRLKQVQLAVATCPASNCAISSILSSKTFGSMVPQNFALHELLHDQGYDVNFILSGDHRFLGLRQFYGNDLTIYFDGTSSRRYVPTDDRLIFEGLDEVPRFEGRPAFFYFHLMSSHVLGHRQDRYVLYRPSIELSEFKDYGGVDLQTHINSYDNGVVQADAIIEQLFDALDQKGYLENALVVILSDHGEGLGEHAGARGHAFNARLYQEFLRIPLLIYDGAGAEYANLELATQVDVAPTIVDRLGLQVPVSWEGKSLLVPGVRPFSYHYMDMYEIPLYAIVHPAGGAIYKYLQQSGREELFELTTDPNERRDLMVSADHAIVTRLRNRLADVLVSVGH